MAFILDDHGGLQTYMAIIVQLVVGELELVEGDHLLHPLRALDQHCHDVDADDHDHGHPLSCGQVHQNVTFKTA